MSNARTRTAALVSLVACIACSASADQVSIQPVKDNTLYEEAGGALSNGIGASLFAGRTASGAIRRAVVAFDIAGSIPAGSTINSVSLDINVAQASGAAASTGLHRATANWGEGTSNATTGGGGGGVASTTGDATWIHRFFSTDPWTTAGGDFVGTPSSTVSISGVAAYSFPSTSQLVADVQQMLDAPATDFGWVVRGEEVTDGVAKRFDSREAATPANRPTLVVDFTAPSPVADWAAYD